MSAREASIAVRRFGLGPRPGDLARIKSDPRGYVLAALGRREGALLEDPGLEPSHVSLVALRQAQQAEQLARALRKDAATAAAAPEAGGMADAKSALASPAQQMEPMANAPQAPARPGVVRREVYQEEAAARLARGASTDAPLLERLVLFWSNHFAVGAQKGPAVRITAGAYEREAIRPHVLGRFVDMLKAVEQHPAMLVYLDNAQSIGPSSRAGQNRNRGLNENLAREILELHTLGVDGGYSQADVTSLARIITGWTVGVERAERAEPGKFLFAPMRHEPGPQTVLGKRYADRGLATGEEALADLARHPATARHIARKLAQHFVSQTPPPALVARLEALFRDSGGDLAVVTRALVTAPEAWEAAPRKVVPPYDFTVSLMRAFELKQTQVQALRVAAAIGQPLWQPPAPKGWPDDDDAWMGPAAIRERLRLAEHVAGQLAKTHDPREAAEGLLGPDMGEHTRLAIGRAETREQGLELLIMSPEFLRR